MLAVHAGGARCVLAVHAVLNATPERWQNPAYDGFYARTEQVCDSKPVYQLVGNVTNPVLYRDYNEWGSWWLGPFDRGPSSHPGQPPKHDCGASFSIEVMWAPAYQCKDSADKCDRWDGPESTAHVRVVNATSHA